MAIEKITGTEIGSAVHNRTHPIYQKCLPTECLTLNSSIQLLIFKQAVSSNLLQCSPQESTTVDTKITCKTLLSWFISNCNKILKMQQPRRKRRDLKTLTLMNWFRSSSPRIQSPTSNSLQSFLNSSYYLNKTQINNKYRLSLTSKHPWLFIELTQLSPLRRKSMNTNNNKKRSYNSHLL